jgi:hypothetical protein
VTACVRRSEGAVVSPAEAVHVGEDAHEILAVRQERPPRRAAVRLVVGGVGQPVAGGDGVELGVELGGGGGAALRRGLRFGVIPGRGRRRGEEAELLLAVAVAAADDELADAAPPRDGPRRPALPRGARRRGRRRRPGHPDAVAVGRHAVQLGDVRGRRRRRLPRPPRGRAHGGEQPAIGLRSARRSAHRQGARRRAVRPGAEPRRSARRRARGRDAGPHPHRLLAFTCVTILKSYTVLMKKE